MTTVIDERVVEMRFNNDDFEKNVAQSMNTLDNLKKSLNFDSAKGLENIGKAAKGFSLTGITETITEATSKFSAFEVAGIAAIANITNKAVDFGLSFAKSLSLDQVTTGLDKYAEKTTAIQTIISATGASIGEVTEQIDKLNWFTDETSYNLTDMISNIAKFTNSGIGLSDAVTQMMGIATAAGDAGKGVQGATHAMEGFSKAMSKQYMDQSSWMWIRTSGIDTIRFKEAMLEAAVAAGTLKEAGDGLYQTLQGNLVTAEDFATNLKDKWMNAEVMQKGLAVYGEFSNRLQEVMESLEFEGTTSDFMDVLDQYKNGAIDASEAADMLNVSSTDLKEILDELASDEFAIGEHAFKMSQEAKTFQEAIDSVKDAVSTGWMTTFEMIFGNYEEAKKLWTGLANDLWEAFASGGAERNEVLAVWKQLGGRDSLIRAAVNFINLFVKPLSTIKTAFKSMFPDVEGMGQVLYNLTERFRAFTESIQPSKETLRDIYFIFKGLFTIGKVVGEVVFGIVKALLPAARPFGSLLEMIIHFLGYIGRVVVALEKFIGSTNIVQVVIAGLGTVFSNLLNILKTIGAVLGSALVGGVGLFISLIGKAITAVSKFISKSGFVTKAINAIGSGINRIRGFFNGFNKSVETATTVVKTLEENFSGANDVIVETGTVTRKTAGEFKQATSPLEAFIKVVRTVGTVLAGVGSIIVGAFTMVGAGVATFFKSFIDRFKQADLTSKNFFDHIKALLTAFVGALGDAGEKIKEVFESIVGGDKFKGIADIIHKITEKIKELTSSLDVGKIAAIAFAGTMVMLVASLAKIVQTVTDTVTSVKTVFDTINKVIKGKFAKKSNTIMDLAKAFAIIAGSLALLVAVNENGEIKEVADAMMALTIAFTVCAAALKGLDFLFAKFSSGIKAPLISTSVLALAGSMAILAGAMYILNEIDIKDGMRKKLVIMGVMLLELVTAAALVSRIAPKLAKGSVLLVALAGAMLIMVRAFKEITSEDLANVQENMVGFGLFFGAMSLMIAAAGKIKITSALSLILVAKAIQMIMPELKAAIKSIDADGTFTKILDTANKFFEKLKEWCKKLVDTIGIVGTTIGALAAIGTIVGSISLLISLFKAIGSLGNLLKGVGMAAAGIGICIVLIANAMKKFAEIKKDMSAEDFKAIGDVIKGFIVAMGIALGAIQLMGVLSNLAGKKLLKWTDNIAVNFAAVAAAFVGIGVSMVLIATALRIAAKINPDDIVKVGLIMALLMAVMSVPLFAAGTIKSGISAMMSMMSAVGAIAVLLAEVAVVSIIVKNTDPNILLAAVSIIGALMLIFSVVLGAASSIKNALPLFATLALIVGSVAAIGTALYFLKDVSWDSLKGPVAAMGIVLMSFVLAVGLLSKIKANLVESAGTIKLLAGVIAGFAVIGAALYFLKGMTWNDVIPSLVSLEIVFATLIGAVAALTFLSRKLTKQKTILVAILLAELIGALALVGYTLNTLKGITWDQIIPTLVSVEAVMLTMLGMLTAMTFLSRKLTKQKTLLIAVLMAEVIAAFVAVGFALMKLSDIPWDSLKGPLISLVSVMGVMTIMMAVVGGISSLMKDWKSVIAAGTLMVGAIGMLAAVGVALYALSEIDLAALVKATLAISVLIGVMTAFATIMTGLTVLLGLVGGVFGVGAAGLFALPVLIAAIAVAMISGAAAFTLAAASVGVFADGLAKLIDPLKQISELDLITISSNLTYLAFACGALGVGLAVFGVGGIAGAAGFALLGAALMLFNASAESAVPNIKALAEIDLKSLAENFKQMAVAGVEMLVGAVGLYAYAKALDVLYASLKKMTDVKDVLGSFTEDFALALNAGSNSLASKALGWFIKVGNAVKVGFNTGAEHHSPPRFVLDFLADFGLALSDNGQLINIATGSAISIGDAFKGGFMGSMDGLGEWFQSFLGGMFGMASNFMYKMRGLLNSTGQEISQFGANGMPTDVINKMYGGTATASSFTEILKEQLNIGDDFFGMMDEGNYILDGFTEGLGGGTEAAEGFGNAMEEAGEKTGKAGKALKEFRDSLKDTIEGQLDMFSKFEMKTEMSAQTILDNMRSNIDGFASWSHRMTVLSERFIEHGISDTLYKKLAEMGPKGYETMNAIYQMTDEQLDELKTLWETGLTLPEGQADIVASGYQYMGEMSVQEFSNALNDHKAAHAAAHGLGQAALDGLAEALDVHSPSKETFKIGVFLIDGLALGMTSESAIAMLELSVQQTTDRILELFNEGFSEDAMAETGTSFLTNLFTNMLGGEDAEENPIITAFANSLLNFELLDEAFITFTEHVSELLNGFFEMADSESPSMLFFRIAQMCYQGFYDSMIQNIITIQLAVTYYCMMLMTYLDGYNLPGKFYDIGMNAVQGMAQGIIDYIPEAVAAAEQLATAVTEAARVTLDINSPSKVFRSIGNSVGEGFVMGIRDGAESVYNAAASLARDGIDGAGTGMGRLQDVINEGLDFNPVITPMLDLSLIRSQMDELNSLMTNPAYGIGQNEGNFSGNPEGQTINFTQNNYSPKALSRYEIYRQTKNQLSTIRKVVTG